MAWFHELRGLPPEYYIIDSDEAPHDGDEQDGRYGLYYGDPYGANGEFIGVHHDLSEIVDMAWEHSKDTNLS